MDMGVANVFRYLAMKSSDDYLSTVAQKVYFCPLCNLNECPGRKPIKKD